MIDLSEIKQAARTVVDERGEPVIQIPLSVWEQFLTQLEPGKSQKAHIEVLLKQWETEPEDDMPGEWWDDFDAFLRANRIHFPERDLGFDEK